MLGPLNQHIVRKLTSFIVAFGLVCTFQPIPASASYDNESCQPTVPYDLTPSEFEELRKELWSTENMIDLGLKLGYSHYPFFHLLVSARHIDRSEFVDSLISLEGLEILSLRKDFCQYVFIREMAFSLRHISISSLLPKYTRNFDLWNSLGNSALRYFPINDYGTAKCIILNVRVESLKLDREPTFKEYPKHCLVR
jgi:hypothetical protein